ncbi:ABC transporter permease [Candidatus Poribacteria bacterium]|nr:ABC transporter permease [Candidatus Poribacteria bacterium]
MMRLPLALSTLDKTDEDIHAIKMECPDIRFVFPHETSFRGILTSRHGGRARPYVEGVTVDYAQGRQWGVKQGRFFTQNDIDTAAQVCVLGSEVAVDLFGETSALGQEVKIKLRWRQPFVRCRVIAVMAPKGQSLRSYLSLNDIVCVPLTTHLQRLSGNRSFSGFTIFFQDGVNPSRIIGSVTDILRKRHRGKDDFIRIWIPKWTVKQLDHIEKLIKIALGGIAGFSLFVRGIGIMNICLVSVGEKTREIGLRKSVGARRIDIFYQFLTESICLCLCGGILGIIGGWFAAHGLARVAVHIAPIVDVWPVVLSVQWIVVSVLFSIFMGIIFGVYPAIRASRLSPMDALRTDT